MLDSVPSFCVIARIATSLPASRAIQHALIDSTFCGMTWGDYFAC